jgi:hypothetical protein
LAELPIKIDEKENISQLVRNVLAFKAQNTSTDTTSIETEIDQLVYQLYGLTDEEVRIVEGEK